jgi:hypothetical protein
MSSSTARLADRTDLATSSHGVRFPMKLVVALLIVVTGLIAGAVLSVRADHWPPDIWDGLDRGRV